MDLQELTKKFENDRPFLYETLRVQLGTLGIESLLIYLILTLDQQQVSVEPEVRVQIADLVKEIMEEGFNIGMYGNPFELEEIIKDKQEKLYDEAISKYTTVISNLSA
jgi:hypothetical protein